MQGDIQPPRSAKSKPAPKTMPEPVHDEPVAADAGVDAAARRKLLMAPRRHFWRLRTFWARLKLVEKLMLIGAVLLFVGAGAVGWVYFAHQKPAPVSVYIPPPPPKPKPPTTVASPLTGLQVTPALAKRSVTGIMIENSIYARPQSGLQDAGVVFEAIAEGGITRFLALFQEAQPQYIGPVRSLRPYYIDFAAPFQASIVHVGGSPEALAEVRDGSFRDLDQFFNSSFFTRIAARPAPHNVYTSFAELDALNKSKGYTASLFTSWPRKGDSKSAAPTAKSINLALSGYDYDVHYDYDAKSNTYLRSEGGAAHLDYVSAADTKGVRLHPKVVIALVMSYSLEADGYHSSYVDTGSGAAYIFQDGGVTVGTWHKAGTTSQISFSDSKGAPIPLDAGQTWLTLVGSAGDISYR